MDFETKKYDLNIDNDDDIKRGGFFNNNFMTQFIESIALTQI